MMEILLSLRPVFAVGISALAALVIILFGNRVHPNVRESFTFIAAGIKVILVYSMLPAVLAGQVISVRVMKIADGLDLYFKADSMGMVFACIASFLWILTSLYSIGYMRGHKEKNQTGYYAAFAMCLCGTIGICFAGNLLTFFIFFEVLTIATYPLVVHYRDENSKKSGRKYLAYTLTSGQLFFAGIVYVYFRCNTTDFVPGGFISPMIAGGAATVLFFLMIGAGAVKAGVMPLHSWLPAAMVAPTPVSALLHAVAVVNAGAFAVIRIVCYTFGPDLTAACGGSRVMTWFAAATIILSSVIAIRKTNLKARLAYSTVGQLSYMVMGVCILAPESLTGAVFHMAAHAFLKITLFMCAGAIMVTTHKADIRDMWGVGKRMPFTMAAFTLASLGIAGLPFLPAFTSKVNLVTGAAKMGQPVLIAVLLASAMLSLAYLLPVGYLAFSKKTVNPDFEQYSMKIRDEANPRMLIPLLCTIVLSFVIGVFPNFGAHMMDLVQMTVASVF